MIIFNNFQEKKSLGKTEVFWYFLLLINGSCELLEGGIKDSKILLSYLHGCIGIKGF